MPFQLSPGVNVSEIDLTTIVPAVATTDAAFVGPFNWGPVDEITLVNNQDTLVDTFGKPDTNVADYWFTASNFLDYGNRLHLVRVVDNTLTGSETLANNATSGSRARLIKNQDDYDEQLDSGFDSVSINGKWAAKYPGTYGNNIRVSICDSYPGQFSNTATGITANTIIGSDIIYVGETPASGNAAFNIGDTIDFGTAGAGTSPTGDYKVTEILVGLGAAEAGSPSKYGNSRIRLNRTTPTSANNVVMDRYWEFYSNFDRAPGTSAYATARGAANDEIHVAISDATGLITGIKGQLLETFPFVSKASDAKTDDGTSNYYKEVITQRSKYVHWLNHPHASDEQKDMDPTTTATSGYVPQDRAWGNTAFYENTPADVVESFKTIAGYDTRKNSAGALNGTPQVFLPDVKTLSGGKGGYDPDTKDESMFQVGYDLFNDAERTDISLVLGGPSTGITAKYIIENVAEKRKDCVAFISPNKTDVVGNSSLSTKLTSVKTFRLGTSVYPGATATATIESKSSSYAVLDSGWKYQYDKYNDKYRWVPLNADIAGLCVRTDTTRDPWWSPAGLNRGHIKNAVKLAWNPQKAHRDELYKNNINPVITMPGQGTLLFGDKTLLSKPSAFDRINVRRLFIVLEKAIAIASKFTLFEFNDEFTRAQFVSLIEPFLRDVQGRRGIFDFKVVCDSTNNTPEVIDRNEFVGDIYIKPARSINFIQLNFIAVRTGVAFEEVVGKF